ncbi:MAG: hypothetical protein ACXVSE_17855, partial [Solirubrobacteraceae bacterium]
MLPGQLRHRPQPHHRRRHDDERDAARVRQAQFRFTFSPAPPKLRPTRRERRWRQFPGRQRRWARRMGPR